MKFRVISGTHLMSNPGGKARKYKTGDVFESDEFVNYTFPDKIEMVEGPLYLAHEEHQQILMSVLENPDDWGCRAALIDWLIDRDYNEAAEIWKKLDLTDVLRFLIAGNDNGMIGWRGLAKFPALGIYLTKETVRNKLAGARVPTYHGHGGVGVAMRFDSDTIRMMYVVALVMPDLLEKYAEASK